MHINKTRRNRDAHTITPKDLIQMAASTMTTADIAAALETNPRTLRKFLRADAADKGNATPGKGSRYALPGDKRSLTSLAKRFTAWQDANAKPAEADEVETPDEA